MGALLNLRIEDLDFERRMLHIRGAKGRKDRYSILSNTAIDMLKQYIKAYNPKDYLYEGQHGGKYSNSSVQKIWKRALSAAGISETYNFHCLRHSFLDSLKLRKTRCDACIGKRNGHTIHSAIVGSPFQQNYGDLYPCIESVYCKYKKPRG